MIIEQLLEELNSLPVTSVCSNCQGSGQILGCERNKFHQTALTMVSTEQQIALTVPSVGAGQCPDCIAGVILTEHGKMVAQLYATLKQTDFVEFGMMVE